MRVRVPHFTETWIPKSIFGMPFALVSVKRRDVHLLTGNDERPVQLHGAFANSKRG